jgi:hypothetical protein
MSVVNISDVVRLRGSSDAIQAFALDAPAPGTAFDSYSLQMYGWVAGREQQPTGVNIMATGNQERNFPLNTLRADAASEFPLPHGVSHNAFQFSLGVARLGRTFELQVAPRLRDGVDPPFFTVKGSRRALPQCAESTFQPIVVTTIGRTGGSWLTHLLNQHPAIICHAPFHHEVRTAIYWAEMFSSITEPRSYLQSIRSEVTDPEWWLGKRVVSPQSLYVQDNFELERWLASDRVEELAPFLGERIESFYRWIAQYDSRPSATHFVEKCWPSAAAQDILFDIYPRAREIFLVRDFRDVLASIVAYSEKRGYQLFNREGEGEFEFVSRLKHDARVLLDAFEFRKDKAMLIRYEDLVTRGHDTLEAVLDYLDVDTDDGTVEGMLREADETRLDGQRAHRTTKSPTESIGRWQRDLDPSLRVICDKAFEEIHAAFGY